MLLIKVIFGVVIFLGGGFRIGFLLLLLGFLFLFFFMVFLGFGGLIGVGFGIGLLSFWWSFIIYKDKILVSVKLCLCYIIGMFILFFVDYI